jgi:hypothetical protein
MELKMIQDTPPEWARSMGRQYARFSSPRRAPDYMGKQARNEFYAGYDAVVAEEAEERRLQKAAD